MKVKATEHKRETSLKLYDINFNWLLNQRLKKGYNIAIPLPSREKDLSVSDDLDWKRPRSTLLFVNYEVTLSLKGPKYLSRSVILTQSSKKQL